MLTNRKPKFSMVTGDGKITLVGPHPEADETWIDYSVANGRKWSSTLDMAQEMMQEALQVPPHVVSEGHCEGKETTALKRSQKHGSQPKVDFP